MKILVDENMPCAYALFSALGEVTQVAGRAIPRELLLQADALMVRSVTKVDAALLAGTPIKFVGTATAGMDHVDDAWLRQQGITFAAAPGCNAISVVEYVFSVLLQLAVRANFSLRDKVVGIIGVGHVGACLNARLQALGVQTLLCDPPRQAAQTASPAELTSTESFVSWDKIVRDADILTFHTPLNTTGPYRSLHLLDNDVLAALPAQRIIINSARGGVIDNAALLLALQKGKKLRVALDVWEQEPNICWPLLALADIGTPHIAGYSLEGKIRGTLQLYSAFSHYLGHPASVVSLASLLPATTNVNAVCFAAGCDAYPLKQLIDLVYDVHYDDATLRQVSAVVGGFDRLRKQYRVRREWSSQAVLCASTKSAQLLQKLGFSAARYSSV